MYISKNPNHLSKTILTRYNFNFNINLTRNQKKLMTLTFVKKESLGKNSSFKNVEKIFVKQRMDDKLRSVVFIYYYAGLSY